MSKNCSREWGDGRGEGWGGVDVTLGVRAPWLLGRIDAPVDTVLSTMPNHSLSGRTLYTESKIMLMYSTEN